MFGAPNSGFGLLSGMGSTPPPEPAHPGAAEPANPGTALPPAAEAAGTAHPEPARPPVQPRRRLLRRLVLSAVIVVGITLALIGASVAWVRITASGHQYSVRDAPKAPVALILGAGLRPDGQPSPYLAARLDVGAQLLAEGKVQVLLVSGDNGSVDYDEVTAMINYLAQRGAPRAKIVGDYAGFDTWDSCVRAAKIFGVRQLLVVTQRFHLPRAIFACRQAGMDASGVWAEARGGGAIQYYTFREQLAAVKVAWDALTGANPRYLGPREDGVDVILSQE